jgi:hypothetical protein
MTDLDVPTPAAEPIIEARGVRKTYDAGSVAVAASRSACCWRSASSER